jgi:leucyl aminopeptidase (aminopeptidase T)
VDIPFSILIEDGFVREILGEGKAASLLRQKLNEATEELPPEKRHLVYSVAELGIGMNASAKPSGISLEEEKRCRPSGTAGPSGTVHIAIGSDVALYGEVNVGVHIDNIIESPTLTVFWPDGYFFLEVLREGILMV